MSGPFPTPTPSTTPPPVPNKKADQKPMDLKKVTPYVKQAEPQKGLVFKAEPWVSGTAYPKGAWVTVDGQKFKSLVGDNHDTPSTSAHDWKLVK